MDHVRIWVSHLRNIEDIYSWADTIGCVCLPCYLAFRDWASKAIVMEFNHAEFTHQEYDKDAYGGDPKKYRTAKEAYERAESSANTAINIMIKECGEILTPPPGI